MGVGMGERYNIDHFVRVAPRRRGAGIENMATTQLIAAGPIVNEPLADYQKPENAAAMRAAIEKVRKELGREYPLVIGGRRIQTTEKIVSINPAKPSEVVGIHQKAGAEHVETAMQAALAAFESWKHA